MNKTLETIINNVANEVHDTTAAMKAIIKPYVNQRYFQVLRTMSFERINYDYSFSTVVGTAVYALPEDFGKPLVVRDVTNDVELAESSLQNLISSRILTFDDSGNLEAYAIYEDVVQNHPTSSSVLSIVSSSASDTTQQVRVRGISGGAEVSESVTLVGTTPATTSNAYTRILGISKDAVTVGKVTITSNTGAVTVCVMSPNSLTSYYKLIRLVYTPSAVVTVDLPYYIKPLPLVNDDDYPIVDIADLIEIGVKADSLRYKNQYQKASVFEAQFASGQADVNWEKENQPNYVPTFNPKTFDKENLY